MGKFKPGDTAWVFCPFYHNEIAECRIVDDNGTFIRYRIVGHYRERPYMAVTDEMFPTREALCEFYRKIFE